MNRASEKAKVICALYHDGYSLTAIAKNYGCLVNNVVEYLDRWYKRIYGSNWVKLRDKRKVRIEQIHDKFVKVYKPFIYSRAEICRELNCSITEFECMLKTYNLTHLRLQTYGTQKTLCNVPKENFEEYKAYANKLGISVRELACRAINEYILFKGGLKDN